MPARINFDSLLADLKEAVAAFDRPRVDAILDRILGAPLPEEDDPFPKEALATLRAKLYFNQMRTLAEHYIRSGLGTLTVWRQYAQALVDGGLCVPALGVIGEALAKAYKNPRLDGGEVVELRGLAGRCHKQLFVESTAADPSVRQGHLESALGWYGGAYRDAPENYWHGINVVALLARASRENLVVPGYPKGSDKKIAAKILTAVETGHDCWELATAVEALIALGPKRYPDALEKARVYVHSKGADAFEIRSTLRQMQEVWQLNDDREPGRSLLPLLRGHLLQRKGDGVTVPAAVVGKTLRKPASLMGVFGEDLQEYEFFVQAMNCAQSVALISCGSKVRGTGFLVNGRREFGERFPDELFLLTCGHVLRPDEIRQAQVRFEVANIVCRIAWRVFWRERFNGDIGLWTLAVEGSGKLPPPLKLIESATDVPKVGDRVVIVGHPEGRNLTYSLANNDVTYVDPFEINYRTPTRPGSSGSPVIDSHWRVVGIHRSGSGKATLAEQSDSNAATNAAKAKEIIMEMGPDQSGCPPKP
jgi:hypothetical protein